jgi:hypothetical protein
MKAPGERDGRHPLRWVRVTEGEAQTRRLRRLEVAGLVIILELDARISRASGGAHPRLYL